MYLGFFKRFFDVVLSLGGIILLMPIFILICILLWFANNGKPLFFQSRPGKQGNIFRVIKFRTMNDRKDAYVKLLPDSERLTWIGNIIRKSSLDEIPQLINVLKGDMSLIGPRPLLIEYLPLYSEKQKRRHEVRPGITGWAQVNGRNAISWEEKFKLDVWYVENVSFGLDVKIFWLTIVKVLRSEGISQPGQASMEAFKGSK